MCIFTGQQIYEGEKLYLLAGRNKLWLIAAARNLCKIDRDLRTFAYNIQESTCQDWESRICQIMLTLWRRNDNRAIRRIDYHMQSTTCHRRRRNHYHKNIEFFKFSLLLWKLHYNLLIIWSDLSICWGQLQVEVVSTVISCSWKGSVNQKGLFVTKTVQCSVAPVVE